MSQQFSALAQLTILPAIFAVTQRLILDLLSQGSRPRIGPIFRKDS